MVLIKGHRFSFSYYKMDKKYIKSDYQWNEADCEAAIKDLQKGKLIRQAAEGHHMDDRTIHSCYTWFQMNFQQIFQH